MVPDTLIFFQYLWTLQLSALMGGHIKCAQSPCDVLVPRYHFLRLVLVQFSSHPCSYCYCFVIPAQPLLLKVAQTTPQKTYFIRSDATILREIAQSSA